MRRRTFLASSAALLGTGAVGRTAARSDTFGPLGSVSLPGTLDAVVDGTTAYVSTIDGFAAVDVADPADPTVLAERRGLLADRDDGPMDGVFDLAVDGDRLVVAGPANTNTRVFNGFVVYDVSDPADPQQVAVHPTTHPIHNLDFVDGVAYLTGNNGSTNPLVAVDVGEDPATAGEWALPDHDSAWGDVSSQLRVLHDVTVHGDRAYLAHWDAGTWIVDVSDPTAMTAVGQVRGRSAAELADIGRRELSREYLQTPGNDHYVTVDEDAALLGVGAEAWDDLSDDHVGGPGGIDLYDISTPTDPVARGRIDPPPTDNPTYGGVWTTAHNFDFAGDRLYASWYRGGVTVHDVSDPANPTEVAAWEDRDSTSFFTAQYVPDNDVFVASNAGTERSPSADTGSLFTFPADAGATDSEGGETTTDTPVAETTTASGGDATATDTPASEADTDDGSESTASGDGPGFGPLAALSALGAGAWYARRRDGQD
jgi:hypothetical protein